MWLIINATDVFCSNISYSWKIEKWKNPCQATFVVLFIKDIFALLFWYKIDKRQRTNINNLKSFSEYLRAPFPCCVNIWKGKHVPDGKPSASIYPCWQDRVTLPLNAPQETPAKKQISLFNILNRVIFLHFIVF